MKLLNVGQRTFITRYGEWKPMEVIEVPDNEAEEYLAYGIEVKIVEHVETVERVDETTQDVVETISKVNKRQKKR